MIFALFLTATILGGMAVFCVAWTVIQLGWSGPAIIELYGLRIKIFRGNHPSGKQQS